MISLQKQCVQNVVSIFIEESGFDTCYTVARQVPVLGMKKCRGVYAEFTDVELLQSDVDLKGFYFFSSIAKYSELYCEQKL